MIRTTFFALAAISAFAQPAFAADQVVAYDRTALSDTAEVESLYARLETAAIKACQADLSGDPLAFYKMDACVEDTVARAIAEIDSPELTAYAGAAPSESRVAAND